MFKNGGYVKDKAVGTRMNMGNRVCFLIIDSTVRPFSALIIDVVVVFIIIVLIKADENLMSHLFMSYARVCNFKVRDFLFMSGT